MGGGGDGECRVGDVRGRGGDCPRERLSVRYFGYATSLSSVQTISGPVHPLLCQPKHSAN